MALRLLDTRNQRAAFSILALGILLAIGLSPFLSGLIGIPVLYVVFGPLHHLLRPRMPRRLAAGLTVGIAMAAILLLALVITGVVVNEAPEIARQVVEGPVLRRLYAVRIGGYQLGPELARLGEQIVGWLGTGAINALGSVTRLTLNLTISLFGFYYLLVEPELARSTFLPFIPFSPANIKLLQDRFRDVTKSTVIGTGLTAMLQGMFVGLAFLVVGLSNPFFWAVVTVIFAVLPVVGSGLVWGPGVVLLALDDRIAAAVGLAAWGLLVVANVDNVIRPLVFSRWAQIHPVVTLVGAFAGIRYMGLLGLLVGPLALSYFFELLRMYRQEYARADGQTGGRAEPPAVLPPGSGSPPEVPAPSP